MPAISDRLNHSLTEGIKAFSPKISKPGFYYTPITPVYESDDLVAGLAYIRYSISVPSAPVILSHLEHLTKIEVGPEPQDFQQTIVAAGNQEKFAFQPFLTGVYRGVGVRHSVPTWNSLGQCKSCQVTSEGVEFEFDGHKFDLTDVVAIPVPFPVTKVTLPFSDFKEYL